MAFLQDNQSLPDHGNAIDDCWNRIGVRGDKTCPELPRHVHCRNCEVHAAAAGRLFDRGLPSDRIAESTTLYSQPKDAEAGGALSVMIFRLGENWLALPTAVVEEVASARPVHSLPHRRSRTVLGLVSVRGSLRVCVSLHEMLGLENADTQRREAARSARGRLIVVCREGSRFAFPADEVHGIHRCALRELQPPPTTLARATMTFTRATFAWSDHAVGCLDDALLFPTLNRSLT